MSDLEQLERIRYKLASHSICQSGVCGMLQTRAPIDKLWMRMAERSKPLKLPDDPHDNLFGEPTGHLLAVWLYSLTLNAMMMDGGDVETIFDPAREDESPELVDDLDVIEKGATLLNNWMALPDDYAGAPDIVYHLIRGNLW